MSLWKRWAISIAYYGTELGCIVCSAGTPPWLGAKVAVACLFVGAGFTFFLAIRDMGWVLNPYWEYDLGMGVCGGCLEMRLLFRNPSGPIAQCKGCLKP